MLPQQRREKIIELIKEKGSATVKDLSSILNVTEMTINRDLRILDREKLINKIHGGAISTKTILTELKFTDRIKSYLREKEIIAKKAVQFIEENDSIILDASTTSIILARQIAKENIHGLTVVTNSNYVIDELKIIPDINIISTGGEYLVKFGSLTGIYTELILSRLRLKKLFFSVAGVSLEEGLTDYEVAEIRVKNVMLGIVDEVNLLVTSHKFNKVSTHKVAPISSINRLITEKNVGDEMLNRIREMGIEVVFA